MLLIIHLNHSHNIQQHTKNIFYCEKNKTHKHLHAQHTMINVSLRWQQIKRNMLVFGRFVFLDNSYLLLQREESPDIHCLSPPSLSHTHTHTHTHTHSLSLSLYFLLLALIFSFFSRAEIAFWGSEKGVSLSKISLKKKNFKPSVKK